MTTQHADMNEQYARRVIAGMMWNPSETDSFDEDVADDIADDRIEEIDLNYRPMMDADISVFATVTELPVKNSKTLDMFRFAVGDFHGLERETEENEDGEVEEEYLVLSFAGFRHGGDIESIGMNEKGLLESDDATKYAFHLRLDE